MTSALLDSALELAAAGWAVFPCWKSGRSAKAPRTPHGHLDASGDPEVIRRWWSLHPDSLIGARVPESLLVIDIDPRNGGSLDALETLAGPLPATLTVWSGRDDGGRHLYFLRPPGTFTAPRLPKGIDLKVHGYLIMPPSAHPVTGQPYRWEITEPAPLPDRLRELLRPLPPTLSVLRAHGGSGRGLVRFVATLTPGQRNAGLYWAARRAAETGLMSRIKSDLVAAGCAVGLPEFEARRTVASAARAIGVAS